MQTKSLAEWTEYIMTVHPVEIDMGLDRVGEVARRLNLLSPSCPVIIVGGTNGKGSTVAGLEAIYSAASFKVGAFTSPHFIRLNEEVRINGQEVEDEVLCDAFEKIEAVRENISLTFFEYKTLAALDIFKHTNLDLIILEVGLGGRLDAVNILSADLAIVTSIDLDHIDRLGPTREAIGVEKAGIFRENQLAVYGDLSPPRSLISAAEKLHVKLFCQGKDFRIDQKSASWHWESGQTRYRDLPLAKLLIENMSIVLMAVTVLQEKLPVSRSSIDQGLALVSLPGRLDVVEGSITRIFDVAHNPAAGLVLAEKLKSLPCTGKTFAVFSMLADKDIVGTVQVLQPQIDHWYIAALPSKRATPVDILVEVLTRAGIKNFSSCKDMIAAYQAAIDNTLPGDRVVVFGSFHTVATIMAGII